MVSKKVQQAFRVEWISDKRTQVEDIIFDSSPLLKTTVFQKGGRVNDYLWKWGEETLETVKEQKTLFATYIPAMWLRNSRAMTGHILQIKKKAIDATKQIWSIKER